MSDPVLIEINIGHDEQAADAEREIVTLCAPPLQTG